MNELEEFYNGWLLSEYPYMPSFEELTQEEKKSLEKSLMFAGFKLHKATNQLGIVMRKDYDAFCNRLKRILSTKL